MSITGGSSGDARKIARSSWACASSTPVGRPPPSLALPLPPRPRPRLQVQPRVLNPLKAPLALEDQFVQRPHTRIQVCVPDPVGVKQIELVRLRHLPGELLKLVEELQIRRRELLLLATRVVFGGGISSAGGHSNGYRPPVSSRTLLCSTAFDPPRRRAKNLAKPSASAKIFCRSNSVVRRKWSVRMSAESSG